MSTAGTAEWLRCLSHIPVPGVTINTGRTPLDAAGYRVARFFHALKMCIEELDEYYTKVVDEYLIPDT